MKSVLTDSAAADYVERQARQWASCPYPTRERFLTELTLDPPDATSNEVGVPLLDEDFLILSTIPSAKGQEWASGRFLERVRDWCAKHQPSRSPNFQT